MNSHLQAQITGAAEPTGSSGENNWLIIEQKEIPESQQIATVEDFNAGIRQLNSGQSAHTAFTQLCPVIYGGESGRRTIGYRLTFYVHRSISVEYEIEVTQGGELLDYTGPTQGYIPKGKSWIINKNKTQQLGWRPLPGSFVSRWEIVFDSKTGKRIFNPNDQPVIEQNDGFVNLLGNTVVGSLRTDGIADVDVYTVIVTQAGGTEWQGDLYATAYWPEGAPREDQQKVSEELFIPECVKEKIEDCLEAIKEIEEEGGDPSESISTYSPPINLDVDNCSGKVFGRTPNT